MLHVAQLMHYILCYMIENMYAFKNKNLILPTQVD